MAADYLTMCDNRQEPMNIRIAHWPAIDNREAKFEERIDVMV